MKPSAEEKNSRSSWDRFHHAAGPRWRRHVEGVKLLRVKTLLVLRHAKSSWNDSARDDHERPLSKRGRRDGPRMGELVRDTD